MPSEVQFAFASMSRLPILGALLRCTGYTGVPRAENEGDRLPETAIALAGLATLLGARLLYWWIRSWTQVQLARLSQQGASERIRSLPPGSVVAERRADQEVRIEIGAAGGEARG